MRAAEEEPEPDEEPDETPALSATATSNLVPTVAEGGREFEFRTDLLGPDQLLDGNTLPGLLTRASAEGWDLVDVIAVADRHAVLLRRHKRASLQARRVGFTPPGS